MNASARDLYLASLDANSELSARRLAEMSRVPDDDPMWMMLFELQRSAREVARGADAVLTNEAFAQRLASAIGDNVAQNERIVGALTMAVNQTYEAASRAIRALEAALRDVARRRAVAPIASLAFAFSLGLTLCCAVLWGSFHAGTDYGYNVGYRVGYHDGIIYERNNK